MKSFYRVIMKPLIISIIILTLTLAGGTILYMNQKIRPDIEKLASEILTLKVADVDHWLYRHTKTAESLALRLGNTPLSQDNRENVLGILESTRQQNQSDYESLGFITLEGEKYLTTGAHFNVTHRDYYKQLLNNPDLTHLSMNIYSKANDAQVILIISKVFNPNNQVTGYISLALPSHYMKEAVTSSNELYSTYIYNSLNNQTLVGKPTTSSAFIQMDKPIPSHTNWRIKLTISRKNLLLSLDNTFIFISALTVILTICFMVIMRRRLASVTRPLEELDQKISAASKGAYHNISPDLAIVELNHIGQTYNQMVDNIHTQQDIIREHARLKNEAEHKALYAQIKPHFLYNTLETIQTMAYDLDSNDIEEAIGHLAAFYRIGLSSDAQIITLEQECQHITSYLSILKLRYGQLFTYKIESDGSLNYPFLKFIIQPLVENAIYHGIKPLGVSGHISLIITKQHNHIEISVANPAPDMTMAQITHINQQLQSGTLSGGYGLYNVNQRLHLRFGSPYGVAVRLDNQLFVATLTHPIIKEAII